MEPDEDLIQIPQDPKPEKPPVSREDGDLLAAIEGPDHGSRPQSPATPVPPPSPAEMRTDFENKKRLIENHPVCSILLLVFLGLAGLETITGLPKTAFNSLLEHVSGKWSNGTAAIEAPNRPAEPVENPPEPTVWHKRAAEWGVRAEAILPEMGPEFSEDRLYSMPWIRYAWRIAVRDYTGAAEIRRGTRMAEAPWIVVRGVQQAILRVLINATAFGEADALAREARAEDRALISVTLGRAYLDYGAPRHASRSFAEALEAVDNIFEPGTRIEILSYIAIGQLDSGAQPDAEQALSQLWPMCCKTCDFQLRYAARAFARANQASKVDELLVRMDGDYQRNLALPGIVAGFANAGKFEEARKRIKSAPSYTTWLRAECLLELADAQMYLGHAAEGQQTLKEIEALPAAETEALLGRGGQFGRIVSVLTDEGLFPLARDFVTTHTTGVTRVHYLVDVAEAAMQADSLAFAREILAIAGQHVEEEKLVDQDCCVALLPICELYQALDETQLLKIQLKRLASECRFAGELSVLAELQATAQDWAAVEQTIERIEPGFEREATYAMARWHLRKGSDPEGAYKELTEYFRTDCKNWSERERYTFCAQVVHALVKFADPNDDAVNLVGM